MGVRGRAARSTPKTFWWRVRAQGALHAVCNFRLLRLSNLREHRTNVVFDLKLMVGWGEHKVVLYQRG